jgi:putative transposase
MVVIDTHLALARRTAAYLPRPDEPDGRTKDAKRVVAVDVTGLPVGPLVVPAFTHENRASELVLEHVTRQSLTNRLELVLVDRGVTPAAARALGRNHDLDVRRVG